ncbi:MAG TPA: cysteine--tRNA ligase [Actinobacteria bacterium]|nr:cysteine--tRNA ligase [Actinomycetota bacterium]
MTIRIYNTLTRKKEDFKPASGRKITMYVCGLTVYNYMHIGNARTFVNFDIIRRYLEFREYEVVFVRNITDVDDKIIKRAAEEKTTTRAIAEKYEEAFKADMNKLGVAAPTHEPRATELIPEMIDLIQVLIDKGFAYEVGGNVWFRVREFDGYGKLSGRALDDMRAGERVEPDPDKDDPLDFALWKSAKVGEPSWSSPWGEGRPGWHIECSAMSLKLLGAGFDIHGGAQDLIFPHHENEIAQSEAATGKQFVRYWIHGGLLNIDKEKMSKSLGNVMLVGALLEQWSANTVRMFMLSTHYRNPLDFTREGLIQAQVNTERLERTIQNIDYALGLDLPVSRLKTLKLWETISETRAHFISVMDDDFNSAEALTAIFAMIKECNSTIEGAQDLPDSEVLEKSRATLIELTKALGVNAEPDVDWLTVEASLRDVADKTIGTIPNGASREAILNAVLERREEARQKKEWAVADDIRDSLLGIGIEIEDTASGTRWKLMKV